MQFVRMRTIDGIFEDEIDDRRLAGRYVIFMFRTIFPYKCVIPSIFIYGLKTEIIWVEATELIGICDDFNF